MVIMMTQKILNSLGIFIATKVLMNGRYSRVAKPSDDLVILVIPVFKTISKLRVFFILRMTSGTNSDVKTIRN